jgi:hypothetical protein
MNAMQILQKQKPTAFFHLRFDIDSRLIIYMKLIPPIVLPFLLKLHGSIRLHPLECKRQPYYSLVAKAKAPLKTEFIR